MTFPHPPTFSIFSKNDSKDLETRKMFEKTVKKFLKGASWLTIDDEPAKVALQAIAKALDTDGVSPALVAQYRLIYNGLMKTRKSTDDSDDDDLLSPEDI